MLRCQHYKQETTAIFTDCSGETKNNNNNYE